MRPPLIDLPERAVHLWVAFPDEWTAPSPIAAARGILDDGEMARMERFRFPRHRHLFLVSHLLVRSALSRYADLPPGAWRFITGENGKPFVDPATAPFALSFSLSHTAGLAVVGVARKSAIGVDAEQAGRGVDAAGLSRRFFSPEEVGALENLPPGRLGEQFPLYWTLKEAYIKALGLGLSHPLDSFAFRLNGQRPFRIDLSAADPQDPRQWRFALIEPRASYVVAFSAASHQEEPLECTCYQALSPDEAAPLKAVPLGLSAGVTLSAACG